MPPGNQAKSGGWAASGTLQTGNVNREVSLQTVFPISGNYTVQFALTPGTVDATHPAPRAEAIITWSCEGNSVTRRISVANGASISGFGQGIKVRIVDTTTLGAGLASEYVVSLQVTPGTRPSVERPPTLIGDDNTIVPQQSSITVQVPDDAGAISVLILAIRAGDTTATVVTQPLPGFIQAAQSDAAGLPLNAYDPRDYGFMPLRPGVKTIVISNFELDLVDTDVFISVLFGIDG